MLIPCTCQLCSNVDLSDNFEECDLLFQLLSSTTRILLQLQQPELCYIHSLSRRFFALLYHARSFIFQTWFVSQMYRLSNALIHVSHTSSYDPYFALCICHIVKVVQKDSVRRNVRCGTSSVFSLTSVSTLRLATERSSFSFIVFLRLFPESRRQYEV